MGVFQFNSSRKIEIIIGNYKIECIGNDHIVDTENGCEL